MLGTLSSWALAVLLLGTHTNTAASTQPAEASVDTESREPLRESVWCWPPSNTAASCLTSGDCWAAATAKGPCRCARCCCFGLLVVGLHAGAGA